MSQSSPSSELITYNLFRTPDHLCQEYLHTFQNSRIREFFLSGFEPGLIGWKLNRGDFYVSLKTTGHVRHAVRDLYEMKVTWFFTALSIGILDRNMHAFSHVHMMCKPLRSKTTGRLPALFINVMNFTIDKIDCHCHPAHSDVRSVFCPMSHPRLPEDGKNHSLTLFKKFFRVASPYIHRVTQLGSHISFAMHVR